ncbi:hypothetical protein GCM10028802_11140 [Terrabacter terrigena]
MAVGAVGWEWSPPVGQAAEWLREVNQALPGGRPSARDTARQLARLCGHDSEVSLPWRSLAEAVGLADAAGRPRAYVEQGVRTLERWGWLEVLTTGAGRGARTTFRLLAGGRVADPPTNGQKNRSAPEGAPDAPSAGLQPARLGE